MSYAARRDNPEIRCGRNGKYGLATVIDKPDREPRAAGAARRLLARRMRILRATHGWSQEVLAELAGLHRSYISGIERTARNVSLAPLSRIPALHGTSTSCTS